MYQEVNNFNQNFEFNNKQSFSSVSDEGNTCSNMKMDQVCEAPRERVCHRYFCYEVPHIVPCNTRIINHHIYRHTYVPQYTCCEENECSNVYDGCQNNFF